MRVMTALMRDDTELFNQFMDNASFKRGLTDTVFSPLTSRLLRETTVLVLWIACCLIRSELARP
ncbi:MAG: hypothetical protein OXC12_02110 [Spirochaetaceae bacterium]|nr:hypothetical protein [Spirochaetaceae bacterium]